jgi:radical SAM protein with 4Fe4S-binding SPASM domain
MNLAETLASPSWIVIQLLEQCNLRCRMCYEWGETGAYRELHNLAMLDLPVAQRVVEEVLPSKPVFEFFGGEPLLYPGIWDLIQVIRAGGCDLSFPTNGTLLAEYADRLVETGPTQLWVSLDGPRDVNDSQRGSGVFEDIMNGLDRLHRARSARNSDFPRLGVTCVVTPANFANIEELFVNCIDVSMLASVSIELQSYATADQVQQYARELRADFDIAATPCAQAYVRDPVEFASIDFAGLARQMRSVRSLCDSRGVRFYSQPRTLETANIQSYFTANWQRMTDRRSRCAVPWISAEISARGDVTTCHTFYDLPIGNVYEQGLLEIWRGAKLKRLQSRLRGRLFPICTACCRYYID